MNPLGRDLSHRDKYEGAVLNTRVRQNQLVRRFFGLSVRWQVDPLLQQSTVRKHLVTDTKQVEIQRALPPTFDTLPPEFGFNLMENGKYPRRLVFSIEPNHCVCIIGSGTCGKTRSSKYTTIFCNYAERVTDYTYCVKDCLFWRPIG